MPVSLLLVEGSLDAQVLGVIAPAGCTVKPADGGTGKNRLKPMAGDRRTAQSVVCYLRDRDFDHHPPQSSDHPEVDAKYRDGTPLGWRWCRHELENYLLEPGLVRATTGWPEEEWQQILADAGARIAMYQASRQAIAIAKSTLPAYFTLSPRPFQGAEFKLPGALDEASNRVWAIDQVATFYAKISKSLAPAAFKSELDSAIERWRNHPTSAQEALMWCSGKDLLAALAPWLHKRRTNPDTLRTLLRDQVLKDPDGARSLLPEWAALVEALRA